jgi:alpha-galactosidase
MASLLSMKVPPSLLGRREFVEKVLSYGAGSLVAATTLRAQGEQAPAPRTHVASNLVDFPEEPVRVFIEHETGKRVAAQPSGNRYSSDRATVSLDRLADGSLAVRVACPKAPLSRVILRWEVAFPSDTLFLGDAWERGYGDLQWRHLQPERVLPWYFAAHQESTRRTFALGVKTQPSGLCCWTVDAEGVSLWIDLRNGGDPSLPGDREIPGATIVGLHAVEGETPLAALTRFCRQLCPKPRLAPAPICGNNNWYYAYGQNFDADAMRRDAAFLAEISAGHKVRPYCVIDAGWNPGGVCPGGPWTSGDPKIFPDMPSLAADMKKLGVRPGIWIRPTALSTVDQASRLRAGPMNDPEKPLDLTLPENLAVIRQDIARMRTWGYELIKHDFSTYDVFARWGKDMGADMTQPGWHFQDQTLTNAEIILRLYRILRDAAEDVVLLGCNTIGHLGAGLFEIQRTGDDTSGRAWERTRRMGINTLAFRLPQHGTFFSSDPDCAVHTEKTPWELDRQFLDLVARSGTALFVSVDPRKVTAEQKQVFSAAMQLALSGGTPGGCEPLDWLHTTCPTQWRFGQEQVTYRWSEPFGTSPLRA